VVISKTGAKGCCCSTGGNGVAVGERGDAQGFVGGPWGPLFINQQTSGYQAAPSQWAMCGRLRVGKCFLHACSSGRSSHVFGLLARFT
jgi:hypothetical protein